MKALRWHPLLWSHQLINTSSSQINVVQLSDPAHGSRHFQVNWVDISLAETIKQPPERGWYMISDWSMFIDAQNSIRVAGYQRFRLEGFLGFLYNLENAYTGPC